jgi:hypothetical protein
MKSNIRKQNNLLLVIILIYSFFFFLSINSAFGGSFQERNTFEVTAHARLAVEKAWETYHHAALGGTLASPSIQTELEMNLHKTRLLLAEAYNAEERGDEKSVDELITKIFGITEQILTESREPKK